MEPLGKPEVARASVVDVKPISVQNVRSPVGIMFAPPRTVTLQRERQPQRLKAPQITVPYQDIVQIPRQPEPQRDITVVDIVPKITDIVIPRNPPDEPKIPRIDVPDVPGRSGGGYLPQFAPFAFPIFGGGGGGGYTGKSKGVRNRLIDIGTLMTRLNRRR